MTRLLIRLFIKDRENTSDARVRRSYITLGSAVGVCCNLLLFAIKLTVGLLSGSVSIMADAFNNLSDIGSCAVTAIGFRLSEKPADKEHPFGHGRMEYMSAMAVAFLITIVGIELFKSSLDKALHPSPLNLGGYTVVLLCVSVAVKLWMFLFNRTLGRKIESAALVATAQDSVNDALSTSAVLLSIIISICFHINIDPFIGMAVALFIIYSGIRTVKETLDPLLGMPPEQETIDAIVSIVCSFDKFVGIHDLIVHNYGPGRSFASLHVEVASDVDTVACHEDIDACERRLQKELGIEVVIHMDPIVTDDALTVETKSRVVEALHSINRRLTLHDFRMVDGTEQVNLIFDVVVPNEFAITNEELKDKISEACKAIDPRYVTVITVDRDYVSGL